MCIVVLPSFLPGVTGSCKSFSLGCAAITCVCLATVFGTGCINLFACYPFVICKAILFFTVCTLVPVLRIVVLPSFLPGVAGCGNKGKILLLCSCIECKIIVTRSTIQRKISSFCISFLFKYKVNVEFTLIGQIYIKSNSIFFGLKLSVVCIIARNIFPADILITVNSFCVNQISTICLSFQSKHHCFFSTNNRLGKSC